MKEIKTYHKDGQIREHCCVNENNKKHDEYKIWHDNGQMWIHCFYKNGLKNGEYKSWHRDGQVCEHDFFYNHKRVYISEYIVDKNNITKEEYFLLQLVYGYFPIIKFINVIK